MLTLAFTARCRTWHSFHMVSSNLILSSGGQTFNLNAEKFSKYFFGCLIFSIPGRTYPVEVLYKGLLRHILEFLYTTVLLTFWVLQSTKTNWRYNVTLTAQVGTLAT
jgi:hypothetical protein